MSGEDNERSSSRRAGKQPALPGRRNVRAGTRASRSTLGSQGSQGYRGARMQPIHGLADDMTTHMATPPPYTPTMSLPMPNTHFSPAEHRVGSSSISGTHLEDFGSPNPVTSTPTSAGGSHSSASGDRSRTRARDSRPASEGSPIPVHVDGNGNFYDNRLARLCTDIYQHAPHIRGTRYGLIPAEHRENYFQDFLTRVIWDRNAIPIDKLRKAFHKKMSDRYKDGMYNLRQPNAKRPHWVSEEIWVAWRREWNMSAYVDVRRKAAANRRAGSTLEDGRAQATHIGGSISSVMIANRMLTTDGNLPAPHRVFERTHSRPEDGYASDDPDAPRVFVTPQAQNVHETFRQLVRETQDELDDVQAFYDSVGGRNKKGRVYGLGSAANEYYGSRSRSQSTDEGGSMGSASQQAQMQEMRDHIDALRARVDRDEERARATPSTADGVQLHSSSMSRKEIVDLIDTTNAVTNARLGRIEEMMARMEQWMMRDPSLRDPPPPDHQ